MEQDTTTDNNGIEPENTGAIRNERGQFVPGVSGNPAGKPPGSLSIVAEIKKQLNQIAEEDPQKRMKFELLVRKVILKAINEGDVSMIKDIIDRIDGKPTQNINISSVDAIRDEYFTKLDNLTRQRAGEADIQE